MESNKYIITRVILVYAFVFLFGLTIIGKVAVIQFKQGAYWKERAQTLTTQEFVVDASRGNIYDSNMNLLATSLPFYEVGIDANTDYLENLSAEEFSKEMDSLSICLAQVGKQKSKREYYLMLMKARANGDRYLPLLKEVSYNELQKIKQFPVCRLGRNKGGFVFNQNNKRERPFQELAARTIGYEKAEVKPIGLEGAYNQYLKGIPGKRLMQKIAGGVWMPISDENEVEPEEGNDIVSTIDINIQDVAENSLRAQLAKNNADHGCVVLMEVATGNVKAIANLTRKDSGNYAENYNYAIGEATVPGSTFKLASLMAAMEDGFIDLNDTFNIGDGTAKFFDLTVKDSHRPEHPKVTVQQIFEQSSNVGVATIISRYYAKNPQRFVDRLYAFNLNQPLGLAIPGEAAPKIKNAADKDWYGTTLPWMAYGYELLITPIQILSLYNAIANDGVMVRPQFLQEVRKKDKVIRKTSPETIGNPPICSKSTVQMARRMMEGVVKNGTGKALSNSIFPIAGKTGTAQLLVNGSYKDSQKNATYQASFVGYFPSDKPKYSCIVVVSAPSAGEYYGAQVAGPVFKDVADKVYAISLDLQTPVNSTNGSIAQHVPSIKFGNAKELAKVMNQIGVKNNIAINTSSWIRRSQIQDTLSIKVVPDKIESDLKHSTVPNLLGMGLKDAVFLLENSGMHVKVSGTGVITKQSIEPGVKFSRGQTIEIELS